MIHLLLLLKELFLFFEVLFGVLVQFLELSVGLCFVSLLLPSVVLFFLHDVLQYCLLVVEPSVFRHNGVPARLDNMILDFPSDQYIQADFPRVFASTHTKGKRQWQQRYIYFFTYTSSGQVWFSIIN